MKNQETDKNKQPKPLAEGDGYATKVYCKNCIYYYDPGIPWCKKKIQEREYNQFNHKIIKNEEFVFPGRENKIGECKYYEIRLPQKWWKKLFVA